MRWRVMEPAGSTSLDWERVSTSSEATGAERPETLQGLLLSCLEWEGSVFPQVLEGEQRSLLLKDRIHTAA